MQNLNLLLAARDNNIELVRQLVKDGANVNYQSEQGYTALHLTKDPKIMEFLLQNGADPEIRDNFVNGFTPLAYAAKDNNLDCMKVLLDHGTNINGLSHNNETALYVAIDHGNYEAAELLLSKGADANLAEATADESPLHAAAAYTNSEDGLMDLLVKFGALINKPNINGETPIFSSQDSANILKLVNLGANINQTNNKAESLIHKMVADPEAIEVLTNLGLDINAQNHDGDTPMHYTAKDDSFLKSLVKIISLGGSIEIKNKSGLTPLMVAEQANSQKAARYLVKKAAI